MQPIDPAVLKCDRYSRPWIKGHHKTVSPSGNDLKLHCQSWPPQIPDKHRGEERTGALNPQERQMAEVFFASTTVSQSELANIVSAKWTGDFVIKNTCALAVRLPPATTPLPEA
jgi:hypothetical protein